MQTNKLFYGKMFVVAIVFHSPVKGLLIFGNVEYFQHFICIFAI